MIRFSLGPILYLAGLTFRRQLLSRKTALAAVFLVLIAALVVVGGAVRPWTPQNLGLWVILKVFGGFFVPLLALAYGTGALGDDRDEKSLGHLLVRPLPRTGIYAGKLLAAALIVIPLALSGLGLLCFLGGLTLSGSSADILATLWPGILLSACAYLCFFQLLAAAFRHSTVIAVAYVFFIEVFIGRMPGILKRISLQFYASSVAYGRGRELGIVPHPREMRSYLPIDGDIALWVLAGLTAALFVLGVLVFARKEYQDVA